MYAGRGPRPQPSHGPWTRAVPKAMAKHGRGRWLRPWLRAKGQGPWATGPWAMGHAPCATSHRQWATAMAFALGHRPWPLAPGPRVRAYGPRFITPYAPRPTARGPWAITMAPRPAAAAHGPHGPWDSAQGPWPGAMGPAPRPMGRWHGQGQRPTTRRRGSDPACPAAARCAGSTPVGICWQASKPAGFGAGLWGGVLRWSGAGFGAGF